MIDSKDITFVVQGAILGKYSDKKEDRYTYLCLKSIRKYFPGSFIILSTWKGSDIKDLDFDLLIENDDPGISILGDFTQNGFRQIVSSIGGIRKVNTKYAAKVRSDLIFKNNNILKYFEKYGDLPYDSKYKLVNRRVVMLTACNPKRRFKFPFNAADWLYFGLTEDIIDIFDIPLVRGKFSGKHEYDNNREKPCESMYSSEQYIWFGFLSKYRKINFQHLRDVSNHNIEESEKYFANNAVLITAKMAGINSLKYPNAIYAQVPCLSDNGLYTFTEYKKMLNKYTPSKIFIFPNILESFIYYIVYNSRYFIRKRSYKLYGIIRTVINVILRKKNDNNLRVKKII